MELAWGAESRGKEKILSKVTFTAGMGDWRGLSCCFWWLKAAAVLANLSGMVQEVLLPYLEQTVIYLRCSESTANNQLQLACFFTLVTEPATLSQLCASEQGSTNPEKVLESLFLHVSSPLILSFSLFSLFFPSAVFITLLSFATLKTSSSLFSYREMCCPDSIML